MERREARRLTYKVKLPGEQERLREMILYIADKCRTAPRFGKVKLNKILWRADFQAFSQRGVPVTGRAYQRLKAGPAPIEMAPVLGEMADGGLIAFELTSFPDGKVEERIIANAKPSLGFFSKDDLRYIDEAIKYYWELTATEASDDSHGVAWKSREDGDPLPYEGAYLSDKKLTGATARRVLKLATLKGWKSR